MTSITATERKSLVLLALGNKRFALPAEIVAELVAPGRLHTFPHTTPLLAGVLVRRRRIVPVYDLAQGLIGHGLPDRRFYLIVERRFGSTGEWSALPVSGQCELVTADVLPPAGDLPPYISGLISLNDEAVELLDLEKLIAMFSGTESATAGAVGAEVPG